MPQKNSLFNSHTVKAQSMASSFNSQVTTIPYLDNIMLQITFTGTPVGTFAVQSSSDYQPNNVNAPVTWTNLVLSGSPVAAGAPDTILITLNQIPSPYIRLAYTAGSSTGTCDLWMSGKEV